jgi:hypothetical protein
LGACLADDPHGNIAVSPKLVSVGDILHIGIGRDDGNPINVDWSYPGGSVLARPAVEPPNFMSGPSLTPVTNCAASATACDFRVDSVAAITTATSFGKGWVALGISGFGEDYFGITSHVIQGTVKNAQGAPLRARIDFILDDPSDTTSVYSRGPASVFSSQTDGTYRIVLPFPRLFEAKIVNSAPCANTPSQFVVVTDDKSVDFVCGAALQAKLTAPKTEVAPGEDLTVTLTITNAGVSSISQVTPPASLGVVGSQGGAVEKMSGPTPSGAFDFPPAASGPFEYVYRGKSTGSVTFSAQVSGKDGSNATVSSNQATLPLQIGGTSFTIIDPRTGDNESVREGARVTFKGAGWDPAGQAIEIFWNGEKVATHPAANLIEGTLVVPSYPEFTFQQSLLGQPPCRAMAEARQGNTAASAPVSGTPGELVIHAQNVFYENGSPVSDSAWSQLCEGAVLYDANGAPLVGRSFFTGSEPAMLVTYPGLHGRPLSDAPDRNQFSDYDHLFIQRRFEDGSTIEQRGTDMIQLFLGHLLVVDAGEPTGLNRIVANHQNFDIRLVTPSESFQFLPMTPAANDFDSDGIEDIIDGELTEDTTGLSFQPKVDAFSREFSNVPLGGVVAGKIIKRGGVTILLSPDPAGIRFSTSSITRLDGRPRVATVRACNTLMRWSGGRRATFTCGSLILSVEQGPVEIALGVGVEVVVPAGVTVEVKQLSPGVFEVRNLPGSGGAATITGPPANEQVAPGQTVQRSAPPDRDGDEVADVADACPDDPDKSAPGVCGCGVLDSDIDQDGLLDCLATTTVTTTTAIGTTSTTALPCNTVRCVIDAARSGSACGDETLPQGVAKKLDRAIAQVEAASGRPAKKARRLYKVAKRLLAKASKKAAGGRRPTLTAECVDELRQAISASIGLLDAARKSP